MNPKVSVIVPCYNQAAFLPKAVESLQAQTLAEWECIIINDGSQDNTAKAASNLALKDTRIRLIQQLNGGCASARNTGMQQAKGTFIQFLDADDTIAPEKFEKQVALMERESMDISNTAFCSEANGVRSKVKSNTLNIYNLLVRWGIGASTPIHSFLYRRDYIQKNRLVFHHSRREDWEWHIRCFENHPRCGDMPEYCGAVYYQNSEGMTGNYIKMQEGNFEFMAYMAGKLSGWNKCLWAVRISEEIWIWLLRMIKYRSTEIAPAISRMYAHKGMLAAAVLMMPIALLGVIHYFIQTYLAR